MEAVLALILIAAAFFAGRGLGRKKPDGDSPAMRQARESAWQEGYAAAVQFLGQQRTSTPAAAEAPAAPEPPAAKPLAAPAIPAEGPPAGPAENPQPQHAAAGYTAAPGWQDRPRILQTGTAQAATPQPAAPMAAARPVKVLSKRERELRNINITLYVAALMIVAAGALFLSFALPPLAKLVALFALAAVFYGGGLAVHATRETLRPAAAAFAGTGLALLPLSAIATYNTVDLNGPTVWLVFSAIATLAVGYATVRFRSRVLAWLAVLILVSTAMAGAATMQRGVFYYLLFLLALSIILLFSATRSRAVRESIFFQALNATAQLIPALVLALAVILYPWLSARDYLWVFFLLTVQLLLSVRLFASLRHLRYLAARASAMLTVIAGCALLELQITAIALIASVLFIAQAVALIMAGKRYRAVFRLDASGWRIERAALWVLGILSVIIAYEALEPGAASAPIGFGVVPVLMLGTLPGLWKHARIEGGALLLLAVVPALDTASDPWRLLPTLVLALAIVLVIRPREAHPWDIAYRLLAWVLCLAIGVTAGRSMGELSYPGQESPLILGSILGAWIALFGWWAADALGSAGIPFIFRGLDLRQLRMACSAAIAVATLGVVSFLAAGQSMAFFGLEPVGWFAVGAGLTVGLALLAGLRATPRSVAEEHRVRAATAVVLALVYLLSMSVPLWQVAPILATVLLAYFLVEARRVQHGSWKVIYAGAAQLVFSSAVYWFTWHMDFDRHGQFAMFTASLVIPQLARLGYGWRQGGALRTELRIIAWGLLAFIPASTLAYLATGQDADRGVLLLTSLLFGLYGAMLFLAESTGGWWRQFYLFAPILALLALIQIPAWNLQTHSGWVRSSWWDTGAAFTMLLVFSAGAGTCEWILRRRQHLTVALGGAMFLPLLVLNAWSAGEGWVIASTGLAAVLFALMVHTRSVAWFALGAGVLTCYTLLDSVMLWRQGQIPSRMQNMDTVWALLGATIIFYLLAASHGRFAEKKPAFPAAFYRAADARGAASRLYLLMGIAAAIGAGAVAHLGHRTAGPVLGGAMLIFALAVALRIFECPRKLEAFTVDILLPLAALLGMSSYAILDELPEASVLTAYASFVLVLLVLWRILRKSPDWANRYLIAAGALANLVMFANLVEANPFTRIYALVFFAALIAYGLKRGNRLYLWWGAATVTLAVLWSLRSLAFLWLVILGVGLIVAAVIKLSRVDTTPKQGPEQPLPPADPGAGMAQPPYNPHATGEDWQNPQPPR